MSGILPDRIGLAARCLVALAAAALLALSSTTCTPRYDDASFYSDVAWGIAEGMRTIYNQNIVGTPAGTVDITAGGPFGAGTVHITGTTSYDAGSHIEAVHLQYDMSGCRISATDSLSHRNVDITLDGAIDEDGSWSDTSDYVSLSYSSAALKVNGTSERGSRQRAVSGTTTYTANRTTLGASAELFGFKVPW